jgi:hypothetical protein
VGKASFSQNSFLGGEWSSQMQGRFDLADYRQGMSVCLNVIPIEEGAAPRRSGTRLGGPTRNGAYAVVREYHVDQQQPYDIELTEHHLRLWRSDADLITVTSTVVSAISSANPAVFTATGHTLVTGDQVLFTLAGATATSYAGIAQILGRQLAVTVIGANTFTVVDALSGAAIDGTLITLSTLGALAVLTVEKILDITTSYAKADLQQVRIVQDGINALLLHSGYAPQIFTLDTSGAFPVGDLDAAVFNDGPYLDIPADGTTLTPGATSGSITFTASSIASINGGLGFAAGDVGRQFRIFSEPPLWAVGTAYVTGNTVKEADVYWTAAQASTGVKPETDNGVNWIISTTAAAWTWGTIASITSASKFVGTLAPAVTYPENIAGGDLLYTTSAVAWQLGAYNAAVGWPSCGAYYQGRIWLGGSTKNRFDASVSNDFGSNGYINFAPTGLDGTVADNNGISGTLNAAEIENFLWMLPNEQGILAGTQSGEWILASSSTGEPITPTSILAREITHYGSRNTPAIQIGRASIMVNRDTRKVYEYMANYFTQKFVADNLTLKAKHLTAGGVAELAYMRELTPVIWCRLDNGGLIGCTYKHDDPIKPMEFNGWHSHELGTGRSVISIQGGPANGGETDTLAMVTQEQPPAWEPSATYVTGQKVADAQAYWVAVQGNSGIEPSLDGGSNWISSVAWCYVEFLQTLWDQGDSLLTAWYVDGGAVPVGGDKLTVGAYNGVNLLYWSATTTYASGVYVVGSDNVVYHSIAGANLNYDPTTDAGVHWTSTTVVVVPFTIVRIYGLWYMIGQTVTAWGAGLDLGDLTVTSSGSIDIPLNAASSLFTDGLLDSITATGCSLLSTDVSLSL